MFVVMTDAFMSGWGHATGKSNYLAIECANSNQLDRAELWARERSEMKRVRIAMNCPRNTSKVLVSVKKFEDMATFKLY